MTIYKVLSLLFLSTVFFNIDAVLAQGGEAPVYQTPYVDPTFGSSYVNFIKSACTEDPTNPSINQYDVY